MEEEKLQKMTDHELLVELVKQQTLTAKHQKREARATLLVFLVLCISCIILVPKAVTTLENADTTLKEVTSLATQASGTLTGIDRMVSGINSLVEDNTEYVNDAIRNLDSIDFDTLNQSIQDLHDVISPLAEILHPWS